MSVVRINAITVPAEHADELVKRFANRAGEVSKMPGFEAFELLRPTDGQGHVLRVYALAFDRGLRELVEQRRVPARPPAPIPRRARSERAATCLRSTSSKRSASVADANPVEQLTGPGGPFEIVIEDVVGYPTQVYKQRMLRCAS